MPAIPGARLRSKACQRTEIWRVPFPCDIRLDRLLAGELGISRSSLERTTAPEYRDSLRKRVRDGQVYMLSKNDLTADKQNGGTSVL